MKQAPFYILEDAPAPRLEAAPPDLVMVDPPPPRSAAVLALGGLAVLSVGFTVLTAGNFVVDQFARSAWLGWATLGVTAAPHLMRVSRWMRAMPQYELGHPERAARIRQRVAARPWLALAGNAYAGVGIPDCIRSGQAAADRVAAGLLAVPAGAPAAA